LSAAGCRLPDHVRHPPRRGIVPPPRRLAPGRTEILETLEAAALVGEGQERDAAVRLHDQRLAERRRGHALQERQP
jgi:hypothetical protein